MLSQDRIISEKEICASIGVCRGTLNNWRKAGTFPNPVRIGARNIGWRQSAFTDWMQSRPATRHI
ncbi:helix-turn-helix transcriptional regulator [Hydrocarboniphaga effusa]